MSVVRSPVRSVVRSPVRSVLGSGALTALQRILALFNASEVGVFYDIQDLSTLWQNTDGTTQVTAAGQTVGRIDDISGNGKHLVMANATYEVDERGIGYIAANGTSTTGVTASIDATSTDAFTIVVAVRKNSDAAGAYVLDFGTGATNGRWQLNAPGTTTAQRYILAARGTTSVAAATTSATYDAPQSAILSAILEISTPETTLRVNGTQVATSASSLGAGNFLNLPLRFGSRSATSNFLPGRLYGLFVRGAPTTLSQIEMVEDFMGNHGIPLVRFAEANNLPNPAVLPGNPSGGWTNTGLARLGDGTWMIANDGRTDEADLTYQPGLIQVSADFSTIINEIDMSSAYATPESIQGVAFDGTDDSIWFCDKANAKVRHCEIDGTLIGSPISLAYNPNGLAYDLVADELYVARDSDATVDIYDASTGTFDRSIECPITDIDHMFYDGHYLYLTRGGNTTDGQIVVCDPTDGSELCRLGPTEGVQAIEGIYVDRSMRKMWICHDGGFHTTATPARSQVSEYRVIGVI